MQARVLVMRDVDGLLLPRDRRAPRHRPPGRGAHAAPAPAAGSRASTRSSPRAAAARHARGAIARLAEGVRQRAATSGRLARHARRCSLCRRLAREMGSSRSLRTTPALQKLAALLPLPWSLSAGGPGSLAGLASERAAALVAAVAIAGAGGAGARDEPRRQRTPGRSPTGQRAAARTGLRPSERAGQPGATASATVRPRRPGSSRRAVGPSAAPRRRHQAPAAAERPEPQAPRAPLSPAPPAGPPAAALPAGSRNPGAPAPKVAGSALFVKPRRSFRSRRSGSPAPG